MAKRRLDACAFVDDEAEESDGHSSGPAEEKDVSAATESLASFVDEVLRAQVHLIDDANLWPPNVELVMDGDGPERVYKALEALGADDFFARLRDEHQLVVPDDKKKGIADAFYTASERVVFATNVLRRTDLLEVYDGYLGSAARPSELRSFLTKLEEVVSGEVDEFIFNHAYDLANRIVTDADEDALSDDDEDLSDEEESGDEDGEESDSDDASESGSDSDGSRSK